MSSIQIQRISITDLDTDAIVNAANEGLWAGGGVCGAVFKAAGHEQLQDACNKIGHCDTGSAVITPGFHLRAKYIIHAVGPRWTDGNHKEPQLLYSAYYKSLELAAENKCHSIGFPLISSGIFGYPVQGAWKKAIQACKDYLDRHKDVSMDIVFAVLNENLIKLGEQALEDYGVSSYKVASHNNRTIMDKPAQHEAFDSERTINEEKQSDKLIIAGKEVDAVFFHLPEEPYGFLSNWYLSPFDLDGKRFSSVEQYIMYRKCITFGDTKSAEAVLATDIPKKQQDIGRYATGYIASVWAGMRQMVGFRGLMAKFSQNEELKQKLLDTGEAWLVECAGSDKVWACGIRLNENERFDAANWTGTNILGFALMEVRRNLREEIG